MPKILKITAFDGLTLDDSSYKPMRVVTRNSRVRNSFYLMSNGTWYDADGNSKSTLVPGTIEATFRVYGTGQGSFDANTSAILLKLGESGTLSGDDASGTNHTCTARCMSIPYRHTPGPHTQYWMDITMEFQQETEFTP